MIKIPQYESALSFYLIFLAILPCVVLCFFGKRFKLLNLLVSIVVILSILGLHTIQLVDFLLFILFETALVFFFKAFRKRCSSELVYHIVFALSIFPLFLVRIGSFHHLVASIIGFTGISYMCFKIWQLLCEIHDGKIEQLHLLDFLLFLVFFPVFSSGPIARWKDFYEEYQSSLDNYYDDYFLTGLRKLLFGIFYKFSLAFFVNKYLMMKIPDEITAVNVVAYMYAYTLYLFFDFAGYSNIAIGISYLMGVKVPENFNLPFLACNMKEFWNRWHMSLSTWFNDYVYGRFVLDNVRNGLFKDTKSASRWGYMFTMTLMGVWHGFSLHYLLYGIYQGACLVATDYWIRSKTYREFKKKKYYSAVCRVVCFQIISFGMLIFSGHFFFK